MTFSPQFAQWNQFFQNVSVSSQTFYQTLDGELKSHQVPNTIVSQVDYRERGLFSSKRIYLKVQRDWLTYIICAAPFGTGFFVSSRQFMSRWNTWPRIALIGLFMLLLDIGVLWWVSWYTHSIRNGLGAAFLLAVPFTMIYLVVVVAWVIKCLVISYYRLDRMGAFQEAVHQLFVGCVNKVLESEGRKPMSDLESKPVLHRLLRRES